MARKTSKSSKPSKTPKSPENDPRGSTHPPDLRILADAFLRQSGSIIVSLDRRGRITYLNDRGYSVLGYPPGSLRARDWFQTACPSEIRGEVRRKFDRIVKNRRDAREGFDSILVGRKGGRRIVFWQNALLRDAAGRVTGVLSSGTDVTEQRHAEELVREREEYFRVTMDSIGDAIITADRAGRIVFLNPVAERLTGWKRAEAAGHRLAEVFRIVDNRTRKPAVDPVKRVLRTGRTAELANHTLLISRSGGEHQIADSAAAIRSSGGGLLGVVLVFRDVTRQYAVTEELRSSRERFRILFEQIVDGVVVAEPDSSRVYLVNSAFSQLTGFSPSELIGKSVLSYHPRKDRDFVRSEFNRQARNRKSVATDIPVMKKDGSVWYADIHTSMLDLEGRQYIMGIFQDVTARRDAELALRASEEKFRTLVESSPMGVHMYQVDAAGRLVFAGANPAADRILGVDHTIFIGREIAEAFPSLRETEVPARYLAAALSGETWQTEQISYKDDRVQGAFLVRAFNTGPARMAAMFLDITERKKLEETLARNEERYRTFMAQSPVGFLVHQGGKIIFANPAACRLLGVGDPATLLARPLDSLVPPERRNEFARRIGAIRDADGQPQACEERLLRSDGSGFEAEIRAMNVEFQGRPAGHLVFYDITERKRMQAERDRIFNFSLDLLCIADFDGTFREVNPAFTSTLGWSRGELLAKPWIEFVHPDDRAASLKAGETLRRGEKVVGFENRYRCSNGEWKWLSWNSIPVPEEKLIFAVIRDVTESRILQETAREVEERLKFAVESAGQGTWDFDSVTGRTTVSERWAGMLGYELAELPAPEKVFEWFQERVHPEDLDGFRAAVGEHLSGKSPSLRFEIRVRTRDGRWALILTVGKAVTSDDHGRPLRVVGMHTDVTEQRLLEEKLRQSEKIEAIGQLAGGVAHDFNNQLTGIMGYADLLSALLADKPDLKQYADQIIAAAKRSATLTSQLLAFARKGKFQSQPVDLHASIAEAVSMLEHSLDKKIRIQRFLGAGEFVIEGDPGQMQNALLNLAINGRDAMPSGGTLTFETSNVTLDEEHRRDSGFNIAAGRYVRVSVSDTGMGMDRETKSHLFEPFFTTKEKGRGTGLGLAAVYGIVKNHHGAISVDSEPGRGSRFSIDLPVVGAAAARQAVRKESGARLPGIRVLIIDDEDEVCRSVSALLESLGCCSAVCRESRQGIEYFRKKHRETDVVLLDMVMPVMSGPEVFRELKSIDPGVKVVISSGYSLNEEAQKLIDGGAAGFLQKPYQRAVLAETLSRVLLG